MLEPYKHIVHASDEGVPTIQLGNGDVSMCPLRGAGMTGIAFMINEGLEIGQVVENEYPNGTEGENGAFFRIITTDPRSFQVLIDTLVEARDNFDFTPETDH